MGAAKMLIVPLVFVIGLGLAFSFWGGGVYEYSEGEDRARFSILNTVRFNWIAIVIFLVNVSFSACLWRICNKGKGS